MSDPVSAHRAAWRQWYESLTLIEKVRYRVVYKIRHVEEWLDDRYDYPEWNDAEKVLPLVCILTLGHTPTPDQCGIPAHDFCAYCGKATPNGYPR